MKYVESPYPHDQHLVRVMVGDPIALSKQYLFNFLDELNNACHKKQIGVTFDELLSTAASYQFKSNLLHEELVRGLAFANLSTGKLFWEHFINYSGIDIPIKNRIDFLGVT